MAKEEKTNSIKTNIKNKYKDFLSFVDVMVIALDKDGIITIVNKKAEEILGRKENELLDRDWFDTCLPENRRNEVRSVFQKIASGHIEMVKTFENPVINSRGKERMIRWFNTELKNEKGEFEGIFCSGQDITGSKETETSLRKTKEKYELVLQTAIDGFCLLDVGGNFVEINEAFVDIIGYSKEELLSMNIVDTMNEKGVKKFNENIKEVLQNGNGRFESINRRKDKKDINLLFTAKLIKDDVRYLSIFVRDVTSEKDAQKALQKSEENYRSIFETAANLITSVNQEGIIVDCNNKIKKYLGYSKQEIIGQSMSKIVHPDDMKKAEVALQEILETGVSYNKSYRMIKKDGSEIKAVINSSAIKDEKGNYAKTICIINDETEKKKAEEKIESLIRFPEENPNSVIRIDAEDKVLYCNRSARQDFFNEAEDTTKMSLPLSWKEFISEAMKKEGSLRKEYTHSDSGKTYLLNFKPAEDKSYVNIYGIDISQRKNSEEDLRKKIKELETFNRVTVNRELRMVTLKKKIKELEKQLESKK